MYKLIIVDDEPLVCVGVQSMLDWASYGIEVVGTARNGQQAMELVDTLRPDIVISDIRMPVKDGLSLAKECGERFGRLPVFIMLTSYDEFEYVRQALQAQAVDYLIKLELDAETLKASIDKALDIVHRRKMFSADPGTLASSQMQALREKFFIRLFNNLFDNEDMYKAQKKDLGIDFSAAAFAVASCELLVPNSGSLCAEEQISLYSNAMRLGRETLKKYLPCYVVPLDIWHFSIVFCMDENAAKEYKSPVREALLQTAASLHSYLGLSLHSALGSVVTNPRELGISYHQAQRCIHGMTDADPVVFCETTAESIGEYSIGIHEIRSSIRKAFEEMDTAALDEALTSVANQYGAHPDELLQAMDTTCNILYMAISLLPEGEALMEEIFADWPDGYRSLYHFRDTGSIASWVRQLRDGCNEKLETRRHTYKEHMVTSVKSYIRDNLGKRLSLQEVAAVFNFNPNYLSQLFSKYSGEGFVEYITKTRIEAAKAMLAQGEMRIYEVAEKLGFESSFYFSKVFKKIEGISPREYLNSLGPLNKDEDCDE